MIKEDTENRKFNKFDTSAYHLENCRINLCRVQHRSPHGDEIDALIQGQPFHLNPLEWMHADYSGCNRKTNFFLLEVGEWIDGKIEYPGALFQLLEKKLSSNFLLHFI